MNEIKSISYSSTNVTTSAYVALGSPTTVPTSKLMCTDTSGKVIKLAVDDGAPIAAVAASLVNQTVTYTAKASGVTGNDISIKLTDPGVESSPLSVSVAGEAVNVSLETSASVAATASLATTTPIAFASVATGSARNTNTITCVVNAAAANPTDTVLVGFTGSAAAITVTVTPNDGTNNGAVPVDLTTAELVELFNTGAVVGKTITLTDGSSLRALQTASGGDATPLANGGEGDGEVATFSGGANSALVSTAGDIVSLLSANADTALLLLVSSSAPSTVLTALALTKLSGGTNATRAIVDLFQLPFNSSLLLPLPSTATIPPGSQLYLKAIDSTANSGSCVVTLLS